MPKQDTALEYLARLVEHMGTLKELAKIELG